MKGMKMMNPASEYLLKLKLLISNTEFKNSYEALQFETVSTKKAGMRYVSAKAKTDSLASYTVDPDMIRQIMEAYGYNDLTIVRCVNNPLLMPTECKESILQIYRAGYIGGFIETNKYYANLAGIPMTIDIEDRNGNPVPKDEIFTIPDKFYDMYSNDDSIYRGCPIHQLPDKYLEAFMNSDYYEELIKEHPEAVYLRHLGSKAVPIEVSRSARDGSILRMDTSKMTDYDVNYGTITVEPEIINCFQNVYVGVQKYVFETLKGDYIDIFPNFPSFIHFLAIYLALGETMNELMRKSTNLIYVNKETVNNFFELYGLPQSLTELTDISEFLKKFRLILKDKGTNCVYRVKDLLGYENTTVYKLGIVKQQIFNNGSPVYKNGQPVQRIVFRRLGPADDSISYFKSSEYSKEYTIEEITSGDPRWWLDVNESYKILSEMNYTLAESKYIQLSTHMSLIDIFWECVILLRGILDNRAEMKFSKININCILDNNNTYPVFDVVLAIVVLMNWNRKRGNDEISDCAMYYPTEDGQYLDLLFGGMNDDMSPKPLVLGRPYKLASFNFDLLNTTEGVEFFEKMKSMEYVNNQEFIPLVSSVLNREQKNLGNALMNECRQIYKYLENKLRDSRTKEEMREVEDVYNHLFLVDPKRNWYGDFNSLDSLLDEFNISERNYSEFVSFLDKVNTKITIRYPDPPDGYPHPEDYDLEFSLYEIMNTNVNDIGAYIEYEGIVKVFTRPDFIEKFMIAVDNLTIMDINGTLLPDVIKTEYREIIRTKVLYDLSDIDGVPKTFEALLFRNNASLYYYLNERRDEDHDSTLRNLIRALEDYVGSNLSGLKFMAHGEREYFRVLREILTYFKSYLVEFTEDEFIYVIDNILDNGGNSNMLKLVDEVSHMSLNMHISDSLSLFDISHVHPDSGKRDISINRENVVVRLRATFNKIKSLSYPIWYDDGNRITREQTFEIDNSKKLKFNLINMNGSYNVIIEKSNL